LSISISISCYCISITDQLIDLQPCAVLLAGNAAAGASRRRCTLAKLKIVELSEKKEAEEKTKKLRIIIARGASSYRAS
jgi:hypothetical protein